MKFNLYVLILGIVSICYKLNAQVYSTAAGTLDINTGTNYASCASPGTKSVSINVSGLSNLTSNNALGQIRFSFSDLDGGGGSLQVVAYLKSPTGTCVKVFDGDTPNLSTSYTGTLGVTMTSSTSCANTLNLANLPASGTSTSFNQSGQFGLFSTGVDLTSLYSGQNPNGNWVLYFFEGSPDPVEFLSASLIFGNPTVTDETANGNNCISAIDWNGSPICASTAISAPSNKNGSTMMPGSVTGAGGTSFTQQIGGVTCDWNAQNDNDVWIKFTAQSNTVCINVSGAEGNTQSIVVTDNNTDGDNNPCTGTTPASSGAGSNDTRWALASCPDKTGTVSDIYTGTSGTQNNQNHCFSATVGQIYYLVVDGTSASQSSIFINGLLGTLFVLPIELSSFDYQCQDNRVILNWTTLSELNNDFFTVMASTDALEWIDINLIKGAGNSSRVNQYEYTIKSNHLNYKYYKLKQTDFDGKISYSKIVYANCNDFEYIKFYPNPFDDVLTIKLNHRIEAVFEISDNLGQMVSSGIVTEDSHQINLNHLAAGIYYLKINQNKIYKIIKK